MATEQTTFIDKTFKDKDGKIALWQMPNIPLLTWILGTILAKLYQTGRAHNLFVNAAFGALFAWALMEIFQGVNYFRRFLGLVILILLVVGKTKSLKN